MHSLTFMPEVKTTLTVVLPTWNDGAALRETLVAFDALSPDVRAQLELVVADGGSDDGTLQILGEHMDMLQVAHSQSDRGVYDAMNRAVGWSRAPWVWVMGSGDLPDSQGLQHALDTLRSSPKDRGHAWKVEALPPVEAGVPASFVPEWGAKLRWRNTMHHQGVIVPRNWLLEHPFDIQYKVLGDYAWMLDRWQSGRNVVCHPEETLAQVAATGLSRQFNKSLYLEEWRMKRTRLAGPSLWFQPLWLWAKWAFKQVSKARRSLGSSTPQ